MVSTLLTKAINLSAFSTFFYVFIAACGAVFAGYGGFTAFRPAQKITYSIYTISGLLLVLALSTTAISFDHAIYLHDLWVLMEALWRQQQGYAVNLDYISPLGPAHDWVYGTALWFHAMSAQTLVLGNVLVCTVCSLASYLTLRKHLSPWLVAAIIFIIVTITLGVRDTDTSFEKSASGFLAPYNRWGWALLVLAAARACIPLKQIDHLGAIILGLMIALAFLLKVSYAGVAIALVVCTALLRPGGVRDLIVSMIACSIFVISADLLNHGQVRAYLADISVFANGQEGSGLRPLKMVRQFGDALIFAVITLLIYFALTFREAQSSLIEWAQTNWKPVIVLGGCIFAGLLSLTQNHNHVGAYTYYLAPFIAIAWSNYLNQENLADVFFDNLATQSIRWPVIALCAIAAIPVMKMPAMDAASVVQQFAETKYRPPMPSYKDTVFEGLLINMVKIGCPDLNMGTYYTSFSCRALRSYETGIDILGKVRPDTFQKDTILTLGFSNPFPARFSSPSTLNTPIWLDYGHSFTSKQDFPPETFFKDVDILIISKFDPDTQLLVREYKTDIAKIFEQKAENEDWIVMTRKSTPLSQ